MEDTIAVAIAASSVLSSLVGYLAVRWQSKRRARHLVQEHQDEEIPEKEPTNFMARHQESDTDNMVFVDAASEGLKMTILTLQPDGNFAAHDRQVSLFSRMANLSRSEAPGNWALVASELADRSSKKGKSS